MAKYRLLQRAIINDQVLEVGIEIGEGTQYPFEGRPGPHMYPLDSDARMKMKKSLEESAAEIDPLQQNYPGDKTTPGFPR